MELFSPAKINLFLQVTGRRPDGYHNLFTLMCCVGLYDRLNLTWGGSKIRVRCSHPDVPEDEANLVWKAAQTFFKASGIMDRGVEIGIEKRIPVGAGLGGGSSNAASVLEGLNRHYKNPFSMRELMSLGLSIGADVPFLLFKQPAVATGVGERLESCAGLPLFHVVLVFPRFSVSTAVVYKKLNLGLTKCEKKLKDFHPKKEKFDVVDHLCNDLESVTASMHPEISMIKEALLSQGACGALMTGSGPTVFGLFADVAHARSACERLGENDSWQVFGVNLLV